MIKTTLAQIATATACAILLVAAARAAETPETILIRRTMANDLSGHRRADMDLVLSAYHDDFVGFSGHGNEDATAWTVEYGDLAKFGQALTRDLEGTRYETERTLPFIHVRGDQAMITSVDSGRVVDRASGNALDVRVRRFWTLRKVEEEWLITALVDDIGDTTLAVPKGPAPATELVNVLQDEAAAWNEGNPRRIASLYDEFVIGCDGYGKSNPELWKIIFSSGEELESFVEFRLSSTTYAIDRAVVRAIVGAGGNQAVAVTRETVRTSHAEGDVVHEQSRDVLWLLSRRAGSWKVTCFCYNTALAN